MLQWIEEIAADVSIDSLPESYQAVALIVGVELALKLSEHLGGVNFYFPKLDGLIRVKRDEAIKRQFDGCNHRELARKYGLTETWIREILATKTPRYEQKDLFGEGNGQ